MWQLPPQRVEQPPPQRVEPPPDNVPPPAAANLAPRVDLNHPGTHLPKKDLPREQKEWVLWQKHSAGPYAKGIFKRSIDEHRDCHQQLVSKAWKSILCTPSFLLSARIRFWAPTVILLPRIMVDPPNPFELQGIDIWAITILFNARMRLRVPTVDVDCLNYDLEYWYLEFVLLAMSST